MPDAIERIDKITEFASSGERSTEGLPLSSGFPQQKKPKRLWFNALFYDITRKTNELIDAVNRLTNQDDPVFQAYAVGDVYTTTLDFKTPEELYSMAIKRTVYSLDEIKENFDSNTKLILFKYCKTLKEPISYNRLIQSGINLFLLLMK